MAGSVNKVAPRAGARIETAARPKQLRKTTCRSPRGSADRNVGRGCRVVFGPESLPARERGSKQELHRQLERIQTSLPARERGSKHPGSSARTTASESLPARERGSKQNSRYRRIPSEWVAPRAGARIETWQQFRASQFAERRSPRGSADRNKIRCMRAATSASSLPARERGSKPARRSWLGSPQESLPARERGSKHRIVVALTAHRGRSPRGSADRNPAASLYEAPVWRSLPARERGSKRSPPVGLRTVARRRSPRGSADRNRSSVTRCGISLQVAPRAGARIETCVGASYYKLMMSLPARERGSKQGRRAHEVERDRRSPRGSADRNRIFRGGKSSGTVVAPRAGARIETTSYAMLPTDLESLPARERGSKLG